jgi:hypothetical protein
VRLRNPHLMKLFRHHLEPNIHMHCLRETLANVAGKTTFQCFICKLERDAMIGHHSMVLTSRQRKSSCVSPLSLNFQMYSTGRGTQQTGPPSRSLTFSKMEGVASPISIADGRRKCIFWLGDENVEMDVHHDLLHLHVQVYL